MSRTSCHTESVHGGCSPDPLDPNPTHRFSPHGRLSAQGFKYRESDSTDWTVDCQMLNLTITTVPRLLSIWAVKKTLKPVQALLDDGDSDEIITEILKPVGFADLVWLRRDWKTPETQFGLLARRSLFRMSLCKQRGLLRILLHITACI